MAEFPELNPNALPRVLTRADAMSRGFTRRAVDHRLRTGRWCRLAPGIYLTKPPPSTRDLDIAAVLRGGPAALLTASAALRHWGFRSAGQRQQRIVLVPASSAGSAWGDIIVRRTTRMPRPHERSGLPLAPVARAVADEALLRRCGDSVQALVAEAVQRRLCTVAELSGELAAGPRQGSARLRAALAEVGHGARSLPEATAGRLLRRAGLTCLVQNAVVQVAGRTLVADFLCRCRRAVIEVDSTEYHLSPRDHEATLLRDQALQLAGYRVLHVKPSQLRDPRDFVELVRRWLATIPVALPCSAACDCARVR